MSNIKKIVVQDTTYNVQDAESLQKPSIEGLPGQVLTMTTDGITWADLPTSEQPTYIDTSALTAFEVIPHTVQINATTSTALDTTYFGTIDKPATINRALPANTIHAMFIRSTVSPVNQDVIVDWGDGTETPLVEGISSPDCYYVTDEENPSEYVYYLKHDYADALASENLTFKKFIIKIFGKKYFAIKYVHSTFTDKTGTATTINLNNTSNLMCRVFDYDLPLADHLINLSSFCYKASHLIYVNNVWNHPVLNFSSTFSNCGNLLTATGIYKLIQDDTNISNTFASDKFLTYTDIIIPCRTVSIANALSGCENLTSSFEELLPKSIFSAVSINVSNAFKYCRVLTDASSELLGKYFWNNHAVTWIGQNTAFTEPGTQDSAINNIIEYVPVSWGGLASDEIIKQSVEDQLADKVSQTVFDQTIGDINSILDEINGEEI